MAKIASLCVFCGSKTGVAPEYRQAAEDLGRIMASRGIRLVYGGGRIGLMGVVAGTMLAQGGKVTGVIPQFLKDMEVENRDVSELVVTNSMHERKQRMFALSDAFVCLPGGLGTVDETIEIVTWKQLRLHDKPIVILNVNGYWNDLIELVEAAIRGGFAHPAVSELFSVVTRVEDIFAALESAPQPKEVVLTSHL